MNVIRSDKLTFPVSLPFELAKRQWLIAVSELRHQSTDLFGGCTFNASVNLFDLRREMATGRPVAADHTVLSTTHGEGQPWNVLAVSQLVSCSDCKSEIRLTCAAMR